MEYTVKALAETAGVSARTLRYYDALGLLRPARISPSGYRIYGPAEVERLRQIMFFREMGLPLGDILRVISDEDYDGAEHLRKHRERLVGELGRIERLIANIDTTLETGGKTMSDKEKFEGFKKGLVEENEKKYGREIRNRYGDDRIDASNKKVMDMGQGYMERADRLAQEVLDALGTAFDTGDPAGEEAQRTAALHKEWLCLYWSEYSPEAHRGLGEMYLADERFKAYYEKKPGMTEFLKKAIDIFTRD